MCHTPWGLSNVIPELQAKLIKAHRTNVNPGNLDSKSSVPSCNSSRYISSCPGQLSSLFLASVDAPEICLGA